MDRLDNYSDDTEADPATHEATTFKKQHWNWWKVLVNMLLNPG